MRQTLSFREKFGYSLGDLAANFVFQAIIALQFDFYTRTYGLTAGQEGTLVFAIGMAVAFFNPVMGIIADRTSTRWGKFRPWLLWSALPFGVIGVLTFTTPALSTGAKLIYAWVTYALLRVIYTVNNVPYATLTAVMTSDPDERNSIASYRQIAANAAGFIIASLAIPMVRVFGHGNDARGYQLTMGLLSLLSIVFFVIAFTSTRERIQPDPQQQTSLWRDLADLVQNRAWVALFLATLFYFTAILIRGNVMLSYFRYVAGNVDVFSWFNGFGLASLIAGVTCSTAVAARMGKRWLFVASLTLTAVLSAALYVIPAHASTVIVAVEAVRQFIYGLSGPVIWSMMGDVADYGEWKTGRRATATVTSAVVFALWVGLALGGGIVGWLNSLFGFVSNAAAQTAHAQSGIVLTGSVFAALAFQASAAAMAFYPIGREMNAQIASELADRRSRYSAS